LKLLAAITAVCLLVSLSADREKTVRALKTAWKKFAKLLGDFALLLVLVSVALTLLPPQTIVKYLEGPGLLLGSVVAALVGCVAFIPGFISYPLAGILHSKGIPYTVIASFVTTLMMVGFLTFPLERRFLGTKLALIRNLMFFVIALLVSLGIGIIYGEVL
jgi:uncharacterized membrane protein YraQ (UPF0718 family)